MNSLRNEIANLLVKIPIDFGGGCSESKAFLIAYLIRRFRMKTTLDIGVYRGRSFFPQALAHMRYTGGLVYGVDPWSRDEAVENDNLKLKEKIDRFISDTDFDAIYRDVDNLRQTLGFENHCVIVRKTSAEAADYFREEKIFFDLIHIDGNHDKAIVMKDADLYLALLKPEGILIMDDISWESVKPAYLQVSKRLPRIFQHIDTPWNDYAVFWNEDSQIKLTLLRVLLRLLRSKYWGTKFS